MKTVLIAGASGLVGSFLLKELCDSNEVGKIFVLSRRPLNLKHPKIFEILSDFQNLEQDFKDLAAIEAIYCCLGTTIKKAGSQKAFREVDFNYVFSLGKWAKTHGVRQFLLVSSQGAHKSSWIFYSKVKGQIEEALSHLDLYSLSIFRPSLLLGPRPEKRLGEDIATIATDLLKPLFKGRLRKFKPIEAKTVARAMVKASIRKRPEKFRIFENEQIEWAIDNVQ